MPKTSTRRKCEVCGTEIPTRPDGKRGAPQRLCAPDTGRPCRRFSKRLSELEGMAQMIIAKTPSVNRGKAIARMRESLRLARIEVCDPSVKR